MLPCPLSRRASTSSPLTRESATTGLSRFDPRSPLQRQLADIFGTCVRRGVGSEPTDAAYAADLRQCARDARAIGAQPEEIVVALRTAYSKVVPATSKTENPPEALMRLIGRMLDAYFEDGSVDESPP